LDSDVSPDRTREVLGVAREVLRYFLRNPEAADTLEGVARWRLTDEQVRRSVEEIDEALGWLVKQGFLLEEPMIGSAPLFCLNEEKAVEAGRFLVNVRNRAKRDKGPN
jgi:hypothetical protein